MHLFLFQGTIKLQIHTSSEKSHQVGDTFETCLSSCQVEARPMETCGSPAKREEGQGTGSTRTLGAPNPCTPNGQAGECRQPPVLVTEDTGAADKGPICLRPAPKTNDQAWRSWKSYSATCSIYTTQACPVRKSVYSLPVDRVSALQEFPGGQRRSGSTAPGQGRQSRVTGSQRLQSVPAFPSPASLSCSSSS